MAGSTGGEGEKEEKEMTDEGEKEEKDEGEKEVALPQKRFYRQRAHCNPMSDHDLIYPVSPSAQDWTPFYSADALMKENRIQFLDVGCGYGGLLISLSRLYPSHMTLGMEIRVKVTDYVQDRIKALRCNHQGEYGNIWCTRANAMKYLPNFFAKHQLSKMFFLYPDPHFKRVKHKMRIINTHLIAEYAFVLRPGGRLYTMTDVEDLHKWMVAKLSAHPLFRRMSDEELKSTEEGKKVTRNEGSKYPAVFERIVEEEGEEMIS